MLTVKDSVRIHRKFKRYLAKNMNQPGFDISQFGTSKRIVTRAYHHGKKEGMIIDINLSTPDRTVDVEGRFTKNEVYFSLIKAGFKSAVYIEHQMPHTLFIATP